MKRNNKKGFTLAELLIVVAIIAVLVAIAVPLFVGSLSKAREARDNANIRAVRGAAVVYLLENSADATMWANPKNGWNITATISSSGELTLQKPAPSAKTDEFPTEGIVTEADGTFTVKVHVDYTEVGDAT